MEVRLWWVLVVKKLFSERVQENHAHHESAFKKTKPKGYCQKGSETRKKIAGPDRFPLKPERDQTKPTAQTLPRGRISDAKGQKVAWFFSMFTFIKDPSLFSPPDPSPLALV